MTSVVSTGRRGRRGGARRRRGAAVGLAAVALALAFPGFGRPTGPIARARTLDAAIFEEVNAVRVSHGLRPVRPSAALTNAAIGHSLEMARRGYFAHSSRDGSAFWRRIGRSYSLAHSQYWAVGENLAWSAEGLSGPRAVRLWLASPKHRAVLLAARWHEAGVSAVRGRDVGGFYGSRDVVIVTMDFGVRR